MGVLTAGSPCAVVLVPLAYVCAIATITRRGVLLKSAAAIDALLTCSTVALDKTGTITQGAVSVADASVVTLTEPPAPAGSTTPHHLHHGHSDCLPPPRIPLPLDLPLPTTSSQFPDASTLACGRPTSLDSSMSDSSSESGMGSEASSEAGSLGHGHRRSGGQQRGWAWASQQDLHQDDRALARAREALAFAVALSRGSNHPVSRAVVALAGAQGEGQGQLEAHLDTDGSHSSHSGHTTSSDHRTSQHTPLNKQVLDKAAYAFSRSSTSSTSSSFSAASSYDSWLSEACAQVQVDEFEQVAGSGVQGVCRMGPEGEPLQVRVGSLAYIRDHIPTSFDVRPLEAAAEAAGAGGSQAVSLVLVTELELGGSGCAAATVANAAGGTEVGAGPDAVHVVVLAFKDQVSPGARAAVRALREGAWRQPGTGVRFPGDAKEVVMLTGDNAHVAASVGAAVGIATIRAGLKPEDKLAYITQFDAARGSVDGGHTSPQAAGEGGVAGSDVPAPCPAQARCPAGGLMMVGDGINDAPALAAARVGVAIAATPSDLVAAAADVIVLNGQGVANLPWLFAVAHKTRAVVHQVGGGAREAQPEKPRILT